MKVYKFGGASIKDRERTFTRDKRINQIVYHNNIRR